jgi:hypothetical protein
MSCDLGLYPVNKGEPYLIYDVKLEPSGTLLIITPSVYTCLFDSGSPHVYSGGQNPSQRAHFDIVMSLTHAPVAVTI